MLNIFILTYYMLNNNTIVDIHKIVHNHINATHNNSKMYCNNSGSKIN